MTDTPAPQDPSTALRKQAGDYADLAEEAMADRAHAIAQTEKHIRRYRLLNGRVNTAADYLLRVFGPEVANGYIDLMLSPGSVQPPAPDATVQSLRVEQDAAAKILMDVVGPGRRGSISLIDLAQIAQDRIFYATLEQTESEQGHKRDQLRLDRALSRAAHLELNAEAVVDHLLKATRDDYSATIDLIDAEFDGYPTSGTKREIAIWNHLDNIDGGRRNIKYATRKMQRLQLKLRQAEGRIEELERQLAEHG